MSDKKQLSIYFKDGDENIMQEMDEILAKVPSLSKNDLIRKILRAEIPKINRSKKALADFLID